MDRIAGTYGSEAIGHAGAGNHPPLEGRSLKSAIWKVFAFHLFRVGLFFGAAYSNYSNSPGTAWLLGIILVYSFLDPQFFMKPDLMTAYLAFTVIFYYCRWVMWWGSAATTIYTADAPAWVKILKDFVWIGFFAVFAFRALTRPRFDRHMPLWFTPRGMVTVFLALIYFALPTLSLIYARGSFFEILLTDMRYPLEYVPFLFLFPFILQGESSIRYVRAFVPLVILSLLFLGVEMFSGRPTGFGGLGRYARYGSIFGSPNDFGLFMMLSVIILLSFLAERAIKMSLKVLALLALCLGALASTISLSSVLAMVFSIITLFLFAKDKVKSALIVLTVVVLAAGLYFAFPDANVPTFLSERLEGLPRLEGGGSAYGHYMSVVLAEDAIARFEPAEYLVGTFQSRNDLMLPETYYLRTFYVRGGASVLILLSLISLSLFEAYLRYRAAQGDRLRRGLFLASFLGVAGVAFACLFIPYLDTFPSNFYFWFLVAIIWCEPMSEIEISQAHAVRPKQQVASGKNQMLGK